MSVYEILTGRIIAALEKGVIPWKKPFSTGFPQNLVSRNEYRGINSLILGCAPYAAPFWLTFNQTRQGGGSVKKGEKGYPVVFWKIIEPEEKRDSKNIEELTSEAQKCKVTGAKGNGKRFALLRYYTVFNVEQTEGIEYPVPKENVPRIDECERIIEKTGAKITNGNMACYIPKIDTVTIPDIGYFKNTEAYYATIFHELTHWTGHQSRLCREGILRINFGSEVYSHEELVAEMGSAFLCAHAGISGTLGDSASYIGGWLKVLRNDKKMVVFAAAQAQKAAEFIIGKGDPDAMQKDSH